MKLPELCSTKLPVGTSHAILQASTRYGITPAAYMRAAIYTQLSADGVCPTVKQL